LNKVHKLKGAIAGGIQRARGQRLDHSANVTERVGNDGARGARALIEDGSSALSTHSREEKGSEKHQEKFHFAASWRRKKLVLILLC
jgi:hypothetical protein